MMNELPPHLHPSVAAPKLAPSRRRRLRRVSRLAHALLIAGWLGAFAATHIPADHMPSLGESDSTLHMVGYAGLSCLLWFVLIVRGWPLWRRIAMMVIMMPIYGALDEMTQPAFHRSCDIHDWLFDCLGTLASLVILEMLWWLGKKAVSRRLAGGTAAKEIDL
jgi:VanZ family protein